MIGDMKDESCQAKLRVPALWLTILDPIIYKHCFSLCHRLSMGESMCGRSLSEYPTTTNIFALYSLDLCQVQSPYKALHSCVPWEIVIHAILSIPDKHVITTR